MLAQADSSPQQLQGLGEDDAQVMRAVTRGDMREAIALCAKAHGPSLGRLCMALVGSQAEAQELAQETLLLAHQALPSFRAEGTIRAFLFGIARRVCSRYIETQVRREGRLRLVSESGSSGQDAAEQLVARQEAERARLALEQLRPSERDAVVMRFEGGLSFREVALACGVDEATARKRVSRAIARLRQTMGES